jgi:tetratricopeptide (TPR) repeat protein
MKKKRKRPGHRSDEFTILTCKVTREPIDTGWNMPPELLEQLPDLHATIKSNPQKAVDILEKLKEKYPNVPQIFNLLGLAYSELGNKTKAYDIAKENYLKNPEYLFAKINYAELFIHKKQFEKIPPIFDNKLDLKLLYPHRDVFHLSEVAAFYGLIGLYYVFTNDMELANSCYKIMENVYPDHPSTKRLLTFL